MLMRGVVFLKLLKLVVPRKHLLLMLLLVLLHLEVLVLLMLELKLVTVLLLLVLEKLLKLGRMLGRVHLLLLKLCIVVLLGIHLGLMLGQWGRPLHARVLHVLPVRKSP